MIEVETDVGNQSFGLHQAANNGIHKTNGTDDHYQFYL